MPRKSSGAAMTARSPARTAERSTAGASSADAAGSMRAPSVAEGGVDERLVQCDPGRHPVAKGGMRGAGVVGEPRGGVPVQPAVLQRLRQVPVEERDHWLDADLVQGVDEPGVVVQTWSVDRAAPVGCTRGQATENR